LLSGNFSAAAAAIQHQRRSLSLSAHDSARVI